MELLTPEELVAIGYSRSRVVMMNEAHSGQRRCIRTRRVGRQVLRTAHDAGVRHIAMEALNPWFVAEANERGVLPAAPGYLGQPEMRDLIGAALALSWTLISYEADMTAKPPSLARFSREERAWRDEQQARNLLAALPPDGPLLVWCGWGHLYKQPRAGWQPMGHQFWRIAEVEPFSIDQTVTVEGLTPKPWPSLSETQKQSVVARGAAGFLAADAPFPTAAVDAVLLSTENALE
jgi:hypothetical protein